MGRGFRAVRAGGSRGVDGQPPGPISRPPRDRWGWEDSIRKPGFRARVRVRTPHTPGQRSPAARRQPAGNRPRSRYTRSRRSATRPTLRDGSRGILSPLLRVGCERLNALRVLTVGRRLQAKDPSSRNVFLICAANLAVARGVQKLLLVHSLVNKALWDLATTSVSVENWSWMGALVVWYSVTSAVLPYQRRSRRPAAILGLWRTVSPGLV